MIFGGLVAWFFGVNAEGKGLEDIAAPLTSVKMGQRLELLPFHGMRGILLAAGASPA
jgi:hypothetical protein